MENKYRVIKINGNYALISESLTTDFDNVEGCHSMRVDFDNEIIAYMLSAFFTDSVCKQYSDSDIEFTDNFISVAEYLKKYVK